MDTKEQIIADFSTAGGSLTYSNSSFFYFKALNISFFLQKISSKNEVPESHLRLGNIYEFQNRDELVATISGLGMEKEKVEKKLGQIEHNLHSEPLLIYLQFFANHIVRK